MHLLMTVQEFTMFPVHVYLYFTLSNSAFTDDSSRFYYIPFHDHFTFVHVLIIKVVLNNILAFKLLKRVTIHVSRFCGSS